MENTNAEKTFVVTGATSGIGLAAAEILVREGYSVIGIGRSAPRCRAAEKRLAGLNSAAEVHCLTADLSLQSEIRRAAAEIRAALESAGRNSLAGLLNNAGCFSFWLEYTPEGIERQWALNHLAPFLLTGELLPLLRAAPAARVVTVSSGSHYGARLDWSDLQSRRRYNGLSVYGRTKLANVLFTAEFNRRLGAAGGLRAYAADPGLVKTEIGLKGTPAFVGWIWRLRQSGGIEPAEAARGIVRLLTDPAVGESREPYWKHGAPAKPDPRALDAESAARLWAVSERMCGLSQDSGRDSVEEYEIAALPAPSA
jgi:retinol dehydrogenase 12